MGLHGVADGIGRIEALDEPAKKLVELIKKLLPAGTTKDLLSGVPLGHPAHPMLTDIPIGSFTSAAVLDLFGGERAERGADALIALGILSAVPTVASGAADWSETYGPDKRVGFVHAVANAGGLALYVLSWLARKSGHRGTGKFLGLAGMSVMTVGGHLGGHMSFARGVGVNHAFLDHEPEDWTDVAAEADVPDTGGLKVEHGGAPILLVRCGREIVGISDRCSHAAGPLHEGVVDSLGCTVTCPWHQSVFSLRDGSVVHGPASVPQTSYEVRTATGRVEVKKRQPVALI